MSLGSNGVDRVCSLQKIPTRIRCTNLCINCSRSARFAPKFVQYRNWTRPHKTWIWGLMGWLGYVRCEKFWCEFVAWTCALIAPVRPNCHPSSCSNEALLNAPKHEFGVQWGGSGALVAKNSIATSLHKLVHSRHQFGRFYTAVRAVTKQSETPQNMSLGTNMMDRLHSLWKIPTQLRCTNLCIKCSSSAHFAPKFMQ
jgi:hypothetical protein